MHHRLTSPLAPTPKPLPRPKPCVTLGKVAWRWTRALAGVAASIALPLTASAQDAALFGAFARSVIGMDIDTYTNVLVGARATGDTCVYAEASGTQARNGTHLVGTGTPTPVLGLLCPIIFTEQPFKAIGQKPGRGVQNVQKFPAPFGSGNAVSSSRTVTAGGVVATGNASWGSAEGRTVIPNPRTRLPMVVTFRSAFHSTSASVNGTPGLAAGESKDPWFFEVFEPEDDLFLNLMIRLRDIELETGVGPRGRSVAQVEAFGAFGLGSTPGANVLLNWAFTESISGNASLRIPSHTLVDASIPLQLGQSYWMVADIRAGAHTTIPEPASLLLLASGLSGLAARGLRRRPRT